MFEMTRDVPFAGTRMLEAPVSATEIATRVSRTTHPDLKNSWVVPMRPEKGYISLVRRCFFDFVLVSLLPRLNPDCCSFAGEGDRQGLPASSPRGQGAPGKKSSPERGASKGGQEGEERKEGAAPRDLRQEPPRGREGGTPSARFSRDFGLRDRGRGRQHTLAR